MRSVTHLFLANLRAPVLWWGVTVASLLGSAHYVRSVIADVRTKPQYVITGAPDFYYLTPDSKVETIEDMHAYQTRLALETLFNRKPSGLENQERRSKLFTEDADLQINKDIIIPSLGEFRNQKLHQKVEIESIEVTLGATAEKGMGAASTRAYGQLIRVGGTAEEGITNEVWSFEVVLEWRNNPTAEDHAMFPTVCTSIKVVDMKKD